MEHKNYQQRLKELKLYSFQCQRERYVNICLATNGWNKKQCFEPESNQARMTYIIKLRAIPGNIPKIHETKIHNYPARKQEQLFYAIPGDLRSLHEGTTEIVKIRLDSWLKTILDEPSIDN